MKFQKLTIHNLASIEDAVIDFETEPLAGSEVFLITGKTGAGKSTLLDAICLALFAKTPRLETTLMQGGTAEGNQALKTSDPRQLLRQGAGEGFAQLAFRGRNGLPYVATWTVARANKKPNGRLQGKKWDLLNRQTDVHLTKDKEITDEMGRAVGLDFAQFCRTTLLAQGEFTRFLNSKDEEKAAILEKITGVDAYSRIGAQVYACTAAKEKEWERAVQAMQGLCTLSDEERENRLAQREELKGRLRTVQQRREALVQAEQWLAQAEELRKRLTTARTDGERATERVQTADFRAKEERVRVWNLTREVRAERKAEREAKAEQERLKGRLLGDLAVRFRSLQGAQSALRDAMERGRQRWQEVQQTLEAEAPRKAWYEGAAERIVELKALDETRRQRKEKEAQVAKGRTYLDVSLLPEQKRARERAAEAEGSWRKGQATLKQEEARLNAWPLKALHRQRDCMQQVLWKVGVLRDHLKGYEQTAQRRQEQQRALDDREQRWRRHCEELKAETPKLEAAEGLRKGALALLEAQRDSVDKFAQALRQRLKVGMQCPVCHQTLQSALPSEEELAALMEQAQQAFDRAEAQYQEALKEVHRLEALVRNEELTLTADRLTWAKDTSLQQAQQRIARDGQELTEHLQEAGPWTTDVKAAAVEEWNRRVSALEEWNRKVSDGEKTRTDGTEPAFETEELYGVLKELEESLQQRQTQVEVQLQQAEQQEALVKRLREQTEAARSAFEQAQEAVGKLDQQFEKAQAKVEALKDLVHTLQESETAYRTRLMEKLGAPEAKASKEVAERGSTTEARLAEETETHPMREAGNWETDPLPFAERLQDAAHRYQRRCRLEALLMQRLEATAARCAKGDELLQQMQVALPLWGSLEALPSPSSAIDLDRLHGLLTELYSTLDLGKSARDRALLHQQTVEAFLKGHPDLSLEQLEALDALPIGLIQAEEQEVKQALEQVLRCQTQREEAEQRARAHAALRPEELDALLASASEKVTEEDWKEEQEEGRRNRALQQACERLRQATEVELGELGERKGALQLELEQDEAKRKQVGERKREAKQKETVYLQWSRLNQLIGDATGKKFRQIAQSYVLSNLIRVANHYLASLSDRYTLKVQPGSFLLLLEDAYQGYASRMASTLSGGESFLVSLALALALSDMGHRLSVDMLFIDEGFGTLSGEPLQQAIQTLRSLHSQAGRKVGIISHVEELRERIPVQIRVEQEGKDSCSRVRVVS